MKSLQDYIDTYRSIAASLSIRGDSAELLIQLLANASYISEVENISYSQEASLEKATQINSKIQHCVNNMYSVFRGHCPRVILNIKPNKPLSFNPFDEVIAGNTFKLYYIGYYPDDKSTITNQESSETKFLSYDEGISYSPLYVVPKMDSNGNTDDSTIKIVCILTKERDGIITKSWKLTSDNTYYVDCIEEDLSNDIQITISGNNKSVTTDFSNHILNGDIFDLTLPAFGSRLYISGTNRSSVSDNESKDYPTDTIITSKYVKYSTLSSYNESDLKRINLKGAELIKGDTESSTSFWVRRGLVEFIPGIFLVKESSRDSLISTHYLANRSRYTNTIFRSNSDLGDLLEKTYPSKIYPGGTKSTYDQGKLKLYYIPKSPNEFLTTEEEKEFIETRKSYYVADEISLSRGEEYSAIFDIEVELYQGTDVTEEIASLLDKYTKKFDVNFLNSEDLVDTPSLHSGSCLGEVETLISKIANVKKLKSLNISYYKDNRLIEKYSKNISSGDLCISDDFRYMLYELQLGAYYNVNYQIKSIL